MMNIEFVNMSDSGIQLENTFDDDEVLPLAEPSKVSER